MSNIRWVLAGVLLAALAGVAGCDHTAAAARFPNAVVPLPVRETATAGVTFDLRSTATISSAVPAIGDYLAAILRPSTGFALPATGASPASSSPAATIDLRLSGAPATVGTQGYSMAITSTRVTIAANTAAGLFAGVQTLLQLLPADAFAHSRKSGPWTVPGGTIVDYPRFTYRGAMLDVARHFFTVAQVERYIDEIALYKINYLHLHLSDDQGWRLAINGWPDLTRLGASTEVGGGPGGFYTQADYSAIVSYAASRYITVVPEIDMPGHTNAALASYPSLNCNGVSPKLFTGITVGFSSLCVRDESTYSFIDQVIGQIAALTPGPYIHIGGDESKATSAADFAAFVQRAQQIVQAHGKTVIGWHDVAKAKLLPTTVAEFWDATAANQPLQTAVAAGTKVIMAPANHAYLDQKYNPATTLGYTWAGLSDVNNAYDWDPGHYLPGVGESSVLGVEAPLFTETIVTPANLDYMAFPRLPAIAELGWSPLASHNVGAFDVRLGAQGPRWAVMGVGYYASTDVTWPDGSRAGVS